MARHPKNEVIFGWTGAENAGAFFGGCLGGPTSLQRTAISIGAVTGVQGAISGGAWMADMLKTKGEFWLPWKADMSERLP
jgi:hypothetical protein